MQSSSQPSCITHGSNDIISTRWRALPRCCAGTSLRLYLNRTHCWKWTSITLYITYYSSLYGRADVSKRAIHITSIFFFVFFFVIFLNGIRKTDRLACVTVSSVNRSRVAQNGFLFSRFPVLITVDGLCRYRSKSTFFFHPPNDHGPGRIIRVVRVGVGRGFENSFVFGSVWERSAEESGVKPKMYTHIHTQLTLWTAFN